MVAPAGKLLFNRNNLAFPEKAVKDGIKRAVVIQFIVTEDGSIVDAAVVHYVDALLDKEALSIVKKKPHWTRAIWEGKYSKSYMKQPITFRFE